MKIVVPVGIVAVATLLGGCISPLAGTTQVTTAAPDGVIEAVSRSSPSQGASDALDTCSLTDTKGRFGTNGPLGIELVSAMGLVPHARDIPDYAPFYPGVIEFETDKPAWVILTSGRLRLPLDPVDLIDPTCVVIDGQFTWFNTGSEVLADGTIKPGPRPNGPPAKLLPALAP